MSLASIRNLFGEAGSDPRQLLDRFADDLEWALDGGTQHGITEIVVQRLARVNSSMAAAAD